MNNVNNLKIGDYVVCIVSCIPLVRDEIVKIKDIVNVRINRQLEQCFVFEGYPNHSFSKRYFKFYDYYNIPYEDGTYPKRPDDKEKPSDNM